MNCEIGSIWRLDGDQYGSHRGHEVTCIGASGHGDDLWCSCSSEDNVCIMVGGLQADLIGHEATRLGKADPGMVEKYNAKVDSRLRKWDFVAYGL